MSTTQIFDEQDEEDFHERAVTERARAMIAALWWDQFAYFPVVSAIGGRAVLFVIAHPDEKVMVDGEVIPPTAVAASNDDYVVYVRSAGEGKRVVTYPGRKTEYIVEGGKVLQLPRKTG